MTEDVRNFKCPSCGGEFNQWEYNPKNKHDEEQYPGSMFMDYAYGPGRLDPENYQCPFCGHRREGDFKIHLMEPLG